MGKKTAQDSSKKLSIYLRVTINSERFEVSTQRYVEPARWSTEAGKVKGVSEEARSMNQYLDSVRQKVYECEKSILQAGQALTKETLRLRWHGVKENLIPWLMYSGTITSNWKH